MVSERNASPLVSQLEAWFPTHQHHPAGLYLVATPIGNLADITLRALYLLSIADLVLCEDTRVTRTLLSTYGITAKTVACHAHNEQERVDEIVEAVRAGKRVALVSDAGTPLISDPGFALSRAVAEAGLHVSSLPGASSVTLAVSLAGQPSDRFLFAGFLPSKSAARDTAIAELSTFPTTLVLLEAPHRLDDSLAALSSGLGNDRPATVLRELTKRHEEIRRGTLGELAAHYAAHGNPKGEIVLVIAPPTPADAATPEAIDALLQAALSTLSVKEASTLVAKQTGQPKRALYARAQQLKDEA